MDRQPLEILKTVFGYEQFRGRQAEIIEHVGSGGDALVLMPTGSGKSLCYQIPAILRPGVGVVVSPLIALMQDQVQALLQAGVRATFINSSLPASVVREIEQQMVAGQFDLVYVAPERLMTDHFLQLLQRTPLALFAIDEAHCVSQWGHDFRPEYLELAKLADRFADVPRMALTATADVPTRRDMVQRLQLRAAERFISGFDRPNIRYRVDIKDNGRRQLLRFLQAEHQGDAGIVYCITRKAVDQTAEWLCDQGLPAVPYHAGLDGALRRTHQQRFLQDDGLIVVATVAFGMGIDKPDVRFVAHLEPPRSLEAYYQETGRAGRDGLPANAWMAYGLADIVAQRRMIENGEAPDEQKRIEYQRLSLLHGYCETTDCRRRVLLNYFGEQAPQTCGNCDTCLQPVDTWDATMAAQKLLSCIYRLQQRFGAGHAIDVLLGNETEKIERFGHSRLSTFGIGTELDRAGWHSVARQLVAKGLLAVDYRYSTLSLAEAAGPVLQGRQSVQLRHDPKARVRRIKKSRSVRRDAAAELKTGQQQQLFDALRTARRRLAVAQSVPPYVVFHDATLKEMAVQRPQSLEAMADIGGVGEARLKKYGVTMLTVISQHAADDEPADAGGEDHGEPGASVPR